MADYGGQAAAIYDPQQQSEEATAGASHTNTLTGLDSEEAKIDPTYAGAFKKAAEARASEAAKTDFDYSEAFDGNNSGLHSNATIQQGNRYQDEVKDLAGKEAQAHTDIGTQRNQENTSYAALRSSIASKYSGLKQGFIADSLSKEADRNLQQHLADQQAALQMKIANMNAASSAASTKAQGKVAFNNALSSIEDKLRSYQASGYKGTSPASRAQAIDAFTRQFGDFVDAGTIKNAVNQTFGRYYIG